MLVATSVCEVVGLLASYWNRPMFPERCRSTAIDNSQVYNTVIRSAGSWLSLGQIVQMLMRRFSWHHLVVMYDQQQGGKCIGGASSIINWLSQSSLKASNYSVFSIPIDDNPTDSDIAFYLQTVVQRTRGWVFIFHRSSLVLRVLTLIMLTSRPVDSLTAQLENKKSGSCCSS